MLPHLLFNGLSGAWTGTSTYALLPFYTPTAVEGILKQNKAIQLYDLERPASDMEIIGIHTHEGCKKAFEDRENFRVMYQKAIRDCTDGHDFMIGGDGDDWMKSSDDDEVDKVNAGAGFDICFFSAGDEVASCEY